MILQIVFNRDTSPVKRLCFNRIERFKLSLCNTLIFLAPWPLRHVFAHLSYSITAVLVNPLHRFCILLFVFRSASAAINGNTLLNDQYYLPYGISRSSDLANNLPYRFNTSLFENCIQVPRSSPSPSIAVRDKLHYRGACALILRNHCPSIFRPHL